MHHQIKVPSNYTEYVSLGKGIAKVVDVTSDANKKSPVIPSKVSSIIVKILRLQIVLYMYTNMHHFLFVRLTIRTPLYA